MESQTFLCFSVPFLLQTWLVLFSTLGTAAQSRTSKLAAPNRALEEEFAISLSTVIPTAALSNDQSILVSQKCIEDSRLLVKAILNRTEWALSIFQASGKLPVDAPRSYLFSGAKGVLDEPGRFDLCVFSKTPTGLFQGQYCSIFLSTSPVNQLLLAKNGSESDMHSVNEKILIHPTMTVATKKRNINPEQNPADMIIGFCLPSSCSAQDLKVTIAHRIGQVTF